MIKPEETCTVIGRTAKLRGDLHCADDLQIDGDFEGSIRLTGGRLTIGSEAFVRADIWAQEAVISGKLEGDIRAVGRVDLRSSAVVTGDVFAGRVSMEENAVLRGYVDPSRVGEEEPPPNNISGLRIVGTDEPNVATAQVENKELDGEHLAIEESLVAPEQVPQPVLRQSRRQLPTALAAFATNGRQDSALAGGAYRNESVPLDEDSLWRDLASEE